jgi:hypothetical protein
MKDLASCHIELVVSGKLLDFADYEMVVLAVGGGLLLFLVEVERTLPCVVEGNVLALEVLEGMGEV